MVLLLSYVETLLGGACDVRKTSHFDPTQNKRNYFGSLKVGLVESEAFNIEHCLGSVTSSYSSCVLLIPPSRFKHTGMLTGARD